MATAKDREAIKIEMAGASEKRQTVLGRGRPTAAQVAEINRAILSAAAEQFIAQGYDGAAMEVIAAAAGITKNTLYARYPAKEDLLRAVVEDRVAAWSAASAQFNYLMGEDLEQRLRYHARNFIKFMNCEEMRGFTGILGGGVASVPQFARALHDTGYRYAMSILASEIEAGTRNEPGPARHPEKIAEMLMAMLHGWHHAESAVRAVSDEEAAAFADQAMDLVMASRAAW